MNCAIFMNRSNKNRIIGSGQCTSYAIYEFTLFVKLVSMDYKII